MLSKYQGFLRFSANYTTNVLFLSVSFFLFFFSLLLQWLEEVLAYAIIF